MNQRQFQFLKKSTSFRVDFISNFLGQFCNGAMQLLLVPVYLSSLGAEAYGLLGLFAALEAWMMILDLGLSTTTAREMARLADNAQRSTGAGHVLRTMEALYWGLNILVALVLLAGSSTWLVAHLNTAQLSAATVQQAAAMLILTLLLRTPLPLYRGVLLGLQRQLLLNCVGISATLLRGIVTMYLLLALDAGLAAFLYWQAFSYALELLVGYLLAWHMLPPHAPARFTARVLSETWKFSGQMGLLALLSLLLTQTDRFIMAKLMDLEHVGYYSTVKALSACLMLCVGPIFNAALPRFTKWHEDKEGSALRGAFHNVSLLTALCACPAAMAIVFNADEVLLVWTGSPEIAAQATLALQISIIGSLINVVLGIPYALTLATGSAWIPVTISLLAVLVTLPVTYLGISWYGLTGAAIGFLAFNLISLTFYPGLIERFILRNLVGVWLMRDVLPPSLISLACYSIPLLAGNYGGMASLAASSVLYSICVWLVYRQRLEVWFRVPVKT